MIKIENIYSNLNSNMLLQRNNQKQSFKEEKIANNSRQSLDNQLQQMASVNISQISFSGKEKLNKRDALLIDVIAEELEISDAEKKKLTKSLSSYLESRNLNSLDHNVKPRDVKAIYNNFVKILKIDTLSESVFAENLKTQLDMRIMSGKNYSKENHLAIHNFEDEGISIYDDFEAIYNENIDEDDMDLNTNFYNERYHQEEENDKKFLVTVALTFGFNDKQVDKLEEKTFSLLSDIGVDFISEVFYYDYEDELEYADGEDLAGEYEKHNKRAEKLYKKYLKDIKKDLKLSDKDMVLFDEEFKNRANSEEIYLPEIHPFDRLSRFAERDVKLADRILRKYIPDQKARKLFIYNMKEDAVLNNVESLFDLFEAGNTLQNIENYLSLSVFEKERNNIALEFCCANSNVENLIHLFNNLDNRDRNFLYKISLTKEGMKMSNAEMNNLLFSYKDYLNNNYPNNDNSMLN